MPCPGHARSSTRTLAGAAVAAALLVPAAAAAADRTVGPGQTYADVDDALAAASSGDRILVYAGTYTGNYLVTRSVEIRGAEPGVVLTVASGSVLAFDSRATGSVVADLTIRGGNASVGGGAKVTRSSVRFEGVVFDGGTTSGAGGGLYCSDSDCTIVDSTFVYNDSAYSGGAIGQLKGNLVVEDSVFTGNTASHRGGAIAVNTATSFTVSGCLFDSNASTASGGGAIAVADTPSVLIAYTIVRLNSSSNTGGGFYTVSSTGEIRGSIFESNHSADEAGGISLHYSDFELVNNIIRNNWAGHAGGGVHLVLPTGGLIRNNLVYGNHSEVTTGGMVVEEGPTDFYNNIVAYNTAVYGGGGITVSRRSESVVAHNTVYANDAGSETIDGITVLEEAGMVVWNNVSVLNDASGISGNDCPFVVVQYNDAWNNGVDGRLNYGGDAAASEGLNGNLAVDPEFVALALTGEMLDDDLHLKAGSLLVDAGDPAVLDADGSRSDMGAFGGPWGADWADLPVDPSWLEYDPGCAPGDDACTCAASDGDGDGVGDAGVCAVVDCDDADPAISPNAPEACDGIDQDCDGYTTCQGDCDDLRAASNPGASETCDGFDDDCDGVADESNAVGCSMYYSDADLDGYGSTQGQCRCGPDAAYPVANDDDCYDWNANARPGQTAWFSGIRGDASHDYDCDGSSTKRWTTNYSWTCGVGTCTLNTEGWRNAVPACGATSSWVPACQGGLYMCTTKNTYSQTQQCR